ncbi:Exc2 family lipoprotein [Enterobacteriaceae bacterium C23F]
MKKLMTIVVAISLAGCAAKSAPEKHAWYFSQHTTGTLNGNFVTPRNKIYSMNLPQFKTVYQQGVADKASGKDKAYANAYAASIRKEAEKPHQMDMTFTSNTSDKWQSTVEYKDAQLWFDELAKTYLDGYNGVQ